MTVTKPTIHLNGTAAITLYNEYTDLREPLLAAQAKLTNAHPHQRDYPDPAKFDAALTEFKRNCEALQKIISYYEALQEHASAAL